MFYEIHPRNAQWLWRFMDGSNEVLSAPQPVSFAECVRAIELMKITLNAPVLLGREHADCLAD
jgi:hypothetical protein